MRKKQAPIQNTKKAVKTCKRKKRKYQYNLMQEKRILKTEKLEHFRQAQEGKRKDDTFQKIYFVKTNMTNDDEIQEMETIF